MSSRPTFFICFLGCIWIAYAQIREWVIWRMLRKNGQSAKAVITDLYPKLKKVKRNIFVWYRFEDHDARSYTGKQWVVTDEYKDLVPGSLISILYLKNKPSISVVENDPGRKDRTFAALFLFIMLLVIMLRTLGY